MILAGVYLKVIYLQSFAFVTLYWVAISFTSFDKCFAVCIFNISFKLQARCFFVKKDGFRVSTDYNKCCKLLNPINYSFGLLKV